MRRNLASNVFPKIPIEKTKIVRVARLEPPSSNQPRHPGKTPTTIPEPVDLPLSKKKDPATKAQVATINEIIETTGSEDG